MIKKILKVLGVLLLIAIAVFLRSAFPIITGYGAKNLCSCAYISNRTANDIISNELGAFPLSLGSFKLNPEDSSATATVWGMAKKKAIYREGLGCTLINDVEEEDLRNQVFNKPAFPYDKDTLSWPLGDLIIDSLLPDFNRQKMAQALEAAFSEPDPESLRLTRAVVVLYKGELIGEKYATGFTQETAQISWSMAKSFTNALVGILVKQGKLDIMQRADVAEWSDPEDPRHAITLDHLMRMSSGLDWNEFYALPSSATNMLFKDASMAATAASVSTAAAPDEVWNYSSGTSNIISQIVREAVSDESYWSFPQHELFHKIGISSGTWEPDASGTFVGSSYLWMTPRDYARFGLLYLNDGIWNEERILPEGWVDYSSAPTPAAPRGTYGAQFWRNGSPATFPNVPEDAYFANGYQGQSIIIIPSKDMVVVRLGYTQADNFDFDKLLSELIQAVE
ncbi:MAG: serine hydrolase [Roseivirga sp.]|nr:serine hydrolase [Roseivirga sp.]